jgi:hypothetical protein
MQVPLRNKLPPRFRCTGLLFRSTPMGKKQTLKITRYTYSLSICNLQTNFKIYHVNTDTRKNALTSKTTPTTLYYLWKITGRLQARLVICAFERSDVLPWKRDVTLSLRCHLRGVVTIWSPYYTSTDDR